jgi:hypothetical protein
MNVIDVMQLMNQEEARQKVKNVFKDIDANNYIIAIDFGSFNIEDVTIQQVKFIYADKENIDKIIGKKKEEQKNEN